MRKEVLERTVRLPAPPHEVWAAVTQADRLSEWFGADVLEIDVRPGGRLVFRDSQGVVRRALVETVERPSTLIFRWLAIEQGPDGVTRPSRATTVEFRLAPADDGTDLTVVETPGTLART